MKKLKLPIRKEPKRAPIGEIMKMNFRSQLHEHIISYAWELWFTINGKDTELTWEDNTPKVIFSIYGIDDFVLNDKTIIKGIGFDVDNVFFYDEYYNWIEVSDISTDDMFSVLNFIESKIEFIKNK